MSGTIVLTALALTILLSFALLYVCDCVSCCDEAKWKVRFIPLFLLPVVLFFASFFYESIQHLTISWIHPTCDVVDVQIPFLVSQYKPADVSSYIKEGYEVAWRHVWSEVGNNAEEVILIRRPNGCRTTAYEALAKEN